MCDRSRHAHSQQAIDRSEVDQMVSTALVKKIMGMTFGEVAELAKAVELLAKRGA